MVVEPNIQATAADAQEHGEEFVANQPIPFVLTDKAIAALNKPSAAKWDILDIAQLVEASLDGFSQEFYGRPWDKMQDRDAARVLKAIAAHVSELRAAQAPAVASQPGRPRRHAAFTSEGGVRADGGAL